MPSTNSTLDILETRFLSGPKTITFLGEAPAMMKLYVLGAGFSALAGGPLVREMLDKTLPENKRAVGKLWKTAQFRAISRALYTLPKIERNIEGIFNLVTSAQFYGAKIGRFPPSHLLRFLTVYISTLIRKRVVNPETLIPYATFRDRYLSEDDIAVVTFNYDLVADQLLVSAKGGLHYGLPALPRFRYFGLRGARKGPHLLKLHGSLSWVRCGTCKSIWMHDRYADHKLGYHCPRSSCSGALRLLIVPPLWNKEPAAKQIDLLWRLARELLLEADEINVIGFSFPYLDRTAIDMFRYCLGTNKSATVNVYNGPNYDYAALSASLGRKFVKTGLRLQDLE